MISKGNMSNRNNNGPEILFAIGAIVVAYLLWQLYVGVKACAEWMHLDWPSAALLLFALLALGVSTLLAFLKDWPLGRVFPWLLCGFYPFTLPALDYWSLSTPGRLVIDGYNYGSAAEVPWYGNGWWQLLMFIVLVGFAYSVNKWQSERY